MNNIEQQQKNFLDFEPNKTIILDTLGADFSPLMAVRAGLRFALNNPSWNLVIFTDEKTKQDIFLNTSVPVNIQFLIFTEFISQSDHPLSFRNKKASSLVKGINYLAQKKAKALVSGANSGVYTLYSYLKLKVNNDISPIFLGLLPSSTHHESRLFFDLGASPFLKPEKLIHHLDFTVKFCKIIYKLDTPKIAILANGTEETKGIEYISNLTTQINKHYSQNYAGKIEGSDLLTTNANIIVCEGWTGNIALKALEGGVKGFLGYLKNNCKKKSLFTKFGLWLVKPFLKEAVSYFTPAGACLLGLNEICIKVHSSSSEDSIYQGLLSSIKYIQTAKSMKE